nr:MAG TPA: hypothetical protein [Caudoviricetes sp.]
MKYLKNLEIRYTDFINNKVCRHNPKSGRVGVEANSRHTTNSPY